MDFGLDGWPLKNLEKKHCAQSQGSRDKPITKSLAYHVCAFWLSWDYADENIDLNEKNDVKTSAFNGKKFINQLIGKIVLSNRLVWLID